MKTDPLKDYKFRKKIEEAHACQLQQRFDQARNLYQAILAETPDAPDAIHGMGILCIQLSQLSEGEQWLKKAIAQSSGNARYWNDLGEAQRMQGHFPEAIESYLRSLELEPHHAGALNNLGTAYLLAGDIEKSEQCLLEAIASQPENPYVHNTLGVILEHSNKFDGALKEYEFAVRLDPGFEEAKSNFADLLARHPELIGSSVNRLLEGLGGE